MNALNAGLVITGNTGPEVIAAIERAEATGITTAWSTVGGT